MKRSLPLWLIAMLVLFAAPSQALATAARVHCTSTGAIGTFSNVFVLDRFGPYVREGYPDQLWNHTDPAYDDGSPPRIALEIYEDPSGDGGFEWWIDGYYSKGEYPNRGDHYLLEGNTVSGGNTVHSLQINQNSPGSHYLDCYVDGSYVAGPWWPHPTGDTSNWAIEVEQVLNSSTYFFMGRQTNCYLMASNGNWYLFDSSWNNRWSQDSPNSPYYIHYNQVHWDWQAER